MGLFKEIICDKSLNGVQLPNDLIVISACNPYRLRARNEEANQHLNAGLVFDAHQTAADGETASADPLRDLVYRVHPLPESMIDSVFDFGSLSADTERVYINAIIRRQLRIYVNDQEE